MAILPLQLPAQIPSTPLNFAPINSVGDAILQNRKEAVTKDLFTGGVPTLPDGSVDYGAMTKALYQHGGFGEADAIAKLQTQRDIISGLQGMGNTVFPVAGAQPSAQPQTAQPAAQPTSIPAPSSRPAVGGGDAKGSVVDIIGAAGIPDDQAGPLIVNISKRLGVDPNAPITDPALRQRVAQAVQPRGGQAAPPQATAPAAAPIAPASSPDADPTLGGLVPPGRTVEQQLALLRRAAALATSTGARDAGKSYLDAIDAIQKRLQPTDAVKNYQFARQQGYPGTMDQWQAEQQQQQANAKGMGEQYVGLYKDLTAGARKGYDTLGTLNVLSDAMKSPGFYSGFGGEQIRMLKSAAVALGADPQGVSSMETFRSQANRAIYSTLGSLGTGISNGDRIFIEAIFPTLSNTPQGNAKMIEIARDVAKRQVVIGRMANEYSRAHGQLDNGFDRALDEYSRANPMFNEQQMKAISALGQKTPAAGGPPPIEGAKKAPDGKWYVPDAKRPGKYLMVQ